MTPEVSIILPTFNERENILPLIAELEKNLPSYQYEILVVDDQSPDGTAQIVQQSAGPRTRVISRTTDHGYAKSIYEGIRQSKGETLVIMDSDFNHRPCDIPRMIDLLREYEFVVASRFMKGGRMRPLWRSFLSYGFNAFIRRATGSRLKDHLFGFFAFKKHCLKGCALEKIFYGFGDYGIRLLYDLQRNDVRIVEMPAVYGARRSGSGNKRLVQTFIQYVGATLAVARR